MLLYLLESSIVSFGRFVLGLGMYCDVSNRKERFPYQIAIKEEKGAYLKFLNLLINDSIFLLDESLKKIPELKEMESQLADTTVWSSRPAQERQERERHYHQQENVQSRPYVQDLFFFF